jgi:hypothetical protein
MSAFQIVATLISLTVIFRLLNHRFFKLPSAIGAMPIALLISLSLAQRSHYNALDCGVVISMFVFGTLINWALGWIGYGWSQAGTRCSVR